MMKRAFTLVELILYVSLSSVVLLGFTLLVPYILETRLKNQVILEVEEQARFVSSFIGREIRNADAVNSPLPGISSTSLSLDVLNASDDPMVFGLTGGVLEVTKGANPAIELTNDKVTVSSLNFTNLTRPDTAGAVRVEFTLEYVNVSGRDNFDYSRDFYLTGVIKKS